jgi:hypothetical protein
VAITIGFPFGVRALSSLNTGFGDLEIWWSRFRRKKPAPFFDDVRPLVGPLGFGKADRTPAAQSGHSSDQRWRLSITKFGSKRALSQLRCWGTQGPYARIERAQGPPDNRLATVVLPRQFGQCLPRSRTLSDLPTLAGIEGRGAFELRTLELGTGAVWSIRRESVYC